MKSKVYIQLKDLPDSPKGTEWSVPKGSGSYYPNGDSSYDYGYYEYYLLDHPEFWELKEKKRWEPELYDLFYYIEWDGLVDSDQWQEHYTDIKAYSVGNCFKTEKKAEAVAQKTRELWKKESEEDES